MKIIKVPFNKIKFTEKEFSEDLRKSLLRISFSFPIKVQQVGSDYLCVDGHKRLSCISSLIQQGVLYEKFEMIPAILVSETRTDNGWSRMRHH